MTYQIETFTTENEIGAFFTFWGNVTILKKDGRSFSKYIIKSKGEPSIPSDWVIESYSFAAPKKLTLKRGEAIDRVTDNLENVYYEVTSLL